MSVQPKDFFAQPLQGQSVWEARDFETSTDWRIELTSAQRDELLDATLRCERLNVEEITASDFPLPNFSPLLAEVRDDILEGRGFALLRNLPVSDLDEANAARLLWGLGQHLGVPQPQDASGALLHHVRDTGANVQGRDDIRTFQTKEAQPWHNDGGDIFLLMCRKAAANGGRSYLVSAHRIFNELLARDKHLAHTVQQEFFFDARGQQLKGHAPVQRAPIFHWHGGRMFVMHKRHYIELAQRFPDVPRLTQAQQEAIDAIEEICNDPAFHLAFYLEPGDLEIANNFSVLHKRGAFDQQSSAISERHMLRLWLGLRDGWPLPEVYRQTREYGPLFEIRA